MNIEDNLASVAANEPILSEGEIASFLPKKNKTMTNSRNQVTPYNFSCPSRLSKEQLKSFYLLHDTLARNLSISLPLFLKINSILNLSSLEQQNYSDYIKMLPDPTVAFTLSMLPLPGQMILELSPTIAFSIIDQQLGGLGKPLKENRAVTEIEKRILEKFVKLIVDGLKVAWQQVAEINFQLVTCETSPKLMQIVSPNEVVLAIIYELQLGDITGNITICLPLVNLEAIIHKFNQVSYTGIKDNSSKETKAIIDSLSNISFPVSAELYGTKAKLSELNSLMPGDFIRLDVPTNKSISLSVGGINKFSGELVNHNKHIAFCVKSKTQDK